MARDVKREIVAALALVASLLIVYARVVTHDFIEWDDPQYITDNPFVKNGLSAAGFRWAFTAFHAVRPAIAASRRPRYEKQ